MALGLTKLYRGAIDGKAFRIYEVTHVGQAANSSVTAGSMGMHYIDAIIGVTNKFDVQTTAGSLLMGMNDISITAQHDKLVWMTSTIAGTQTVSVIGW
jgi:hypothetical protein